MSVEDETIKSDSMRVRPGSPRGCLSRHVHRATENLDTHSSSQISEAGRVNFGAICRGI